MAKELRPAKQKRLRVGYTTGLVKLQDVAKYSGASTASVSRALNEPHKVAPELRKRILKAVDKLGWVPNAAGRALASMRSRTIGAIIPTLGHENFARGVEALQSRCLGAGYILLLACSEYSVTQAYQQAVRMIERGVDGMVLFGENHDPRLWPLLEKQRIPFIVTNTARPGGPFPSVGFNNFQAFARATEYLLDLGHKRFGMIALPAKDNDRFKARIAGVVHTLKQRGLAISADHLVERTWSIAEGRRCYRQIMSTTRRPTALICGNDLLAIGAIVESQAMGIRVPQHVSIIGFDDLEYSANTDPPLTTMRIQDDEIGYAAASYLISRLAGADHVQVPAEIKVELVVRGSTGPPPRS